MASEVPAPTGTLRHSDAEALAADLRDLMDRGPVQVDLSGLDGLDFGPLQVLLAAAATAARRGVAFDIVAPAGGALALALTAHALDGVLALRDSRPTLPEKTE